MLTLAPPTFPLRARRLYGPPRAQFKGDKPAEKKRKHKSSSSSSKRAQQPASDEELDGWLSIPSASLALGPVYLTLPATALSPPLCLALQPTTLKVYPHLLPASASSSGPTASTSQAITPLDLLQHEELEGAEVVASTSGGSEEAAPTDVHHVWVCTRIPDTDDKVTLRSATGRFLAADELGRITADREARGLQEEWTIAQAEGGSGFVLRSAYGKVLAVDQMAGGKMELRAEGDEEDEFGRWRVAMQGEYVAKARKQRDARLGIKANTKADGLTIVKDLAGTEAAET